MLTENTLLVLAGLKRLIDTDSLARKWVEHNAAELASKSPQTDSARKWLNLNVSFSKGALRDALAQVYGSGWAFGTVDGLDQLSGGVGDPWANWNAGNEAAAALVDPPKGLQSLLDKSNITIEGISNTILDQIGSNLADSLSQGLGAQDTADNLSDIIDNPLKAMVIARTESARAISDSNVASYQDYGVKQISWLASDPCNICAINDGQVVDIGDQFNSGDLYPPAHPNCVCDVTPVSQIDIGDGGGVDAVDGVLSVSPDGEDDIIHGGVVDGGKFVNADLGKYSPDQERDSHGRFGSGSSSSESKDGKQITSENALEQLWTPAFLQHDKSGYIAPALETAKNGKDTTETQMAIKEQAGEIKEGTVKALNESEIMQNVSTDKLLAASDRVLSLRQGYGSVEAARYQETMHEALVPPAGAETEDGENPINLVEQSDGEIGLVHWADVVDYGIMQKYGVTDGLATPEQVEKMVAEQNRLNAKNDASYSYAVTGSDDAVNMVRESSTSLLVQQWANTSNDNNLVSLGLQRAAAEQLGITNYEQWTGAKVNEGAQDAVYAKHEEVFRAFVQAQYDITQAFLAQQGITSITAYRGEVGTHKESPDTASLRPLSSWSTSHDVAENFISTFKDSTIYTATIPASQIVSVAGTGVGCAHEFEIVTGAGQLKLDNIEHVAGDTNYKAKKKIVNLDKDDLHADWIKTLSWDLPTKVRPFLISIGFNWEHFKTLPAFKAMPQHLVHDVEVYVKNQADKTINKYSPDQERDSHGRFGAGTSATENTMSHSERVRLQKSTDSQKDKLYKAELTVAKPVDKSAMPTSPKREDFATYDEYAEAYKQYSKDWNAWALEQQTNRISDEAQHHLDGTTKGLQGYITAITSSDWFVQQFGDTLKGVKGVLKTSNSYSGRYVYGLKIGTLVNEINIDKISAKDELTVLHEIAHFATTQSVDKPYEGHGSEFAQNHLFITAHVLGDEYAAALEKAYIDGGVSFGK